MKTPILETERLILRPFSDEDAEAVFYGLGIHELVGRFAKENPASGNVMRKLGFWYEKDIPYECNGGKVQLVGEQWRLRLIIEC